jgi:putative ABC transport system ATP-binding protein
MLDGPVCPFLAWETRFRAENVKRENSIAMNMNELPLGQALAAHVVGVHKEYMLGTTVVPALRGVDLDLALGSFSVIQGPSGSGKSTLLHLLGCIDVPSAGTIAIAEHDVGSMSEPERTSFRARHVGFVFQSFNLISVLTVAENVEYPLQLCEPNRRKRRERSMAALAAVGLADLHARRPVELSGGQRQRVAVARALVKQPKLVLADEPTANLDRRCGADLIALMRSMQRASGTTFVVSSHDPQLIEDADIQIRIEDGRIVDRSARAAFRSKA